MQFEPINFTSQNGHQDQWQAEICEYGANCVNLTLTRDGTTYHLIEPATHDDVRRRPISYGCPLLFPYANRISDCHEQPAFTWQGQRYEVPPPGRHGLIRNRVWRFQEVDRSRIQLGTLVEPDEAGVYFPFHFQSSVTYELNSDGLHISFTVHNLGQQDLPYTAGFHPYLAVNWDRRVDVILPAYERAVMDEQLTVPTGQWLRAKDYYDFHTIGAYFMGRREYDTVFRNIDPMPGTSTAECLVRYEVTEQHVKTVETKLRYDADTLPYLGFCTPAERNSVCIEPYTGATNAHNHPENGLRMLPPGEKATFRLCISAAIR